MNILFLVNELDDISPVKHAASIADSLPRSTFRTYAYSLRKSGILSDYFHRVFGSRFYVSGGSALFDIWRIACIIRRERIDIIQTAALRGDAVAILSRCLIWGRRKPVHIAVRQNYLFTEKTLYAVVKNIVYILSCHCVTLNVCVARYIQQNLVTYFYVPTDKTSVIPNSTPLLSDRVASLRVAKRLGLKANIPVIVYIGRLISRKNVLYLLQALEHVRGRYYCLLVGSGSEEDEIRKFIKHKGWDKQVILEPHQEVGGFLALADIFVLPSQDEGLSFALLEAMRAGLPCVATDIPANRELIRHDYNGLIVPLGSSQLFAKALDKLLSSPNMRHTLGQRAKEMAVRHYGFSRMIRTYRSIYDGFRSQRRTVSV